MIQLGHASLTVVSRKTKRKEMFYITTPSTHFIYGYMSSDHSDSERGNPLPPHRLLFSIKQQGIFYMHFFIDRTVHTTAFDKPVVDHCLERENSPNCSWVHPMKDRSDDRPLS